MKSQLFAGGKREGIASGRGVVSGGHLGMVENVDVAPTIAKLFGLEMMGVDGKPMSDVVAKN